jgi:two-component system, cell cycle sensor histidine kinase and response regulator CckA
MAPVWLRVLIAFALAALPETAIAQIAGDDCSGFWCLLDSVMPLAAVIAITILVVVAVVSVRRFLTGTEPDGLVERIERREWPVVVTRHDGRVVATNWAMRDVATPRRAVLEMLEPLLGASAAEIYRLSRFAVRDGLALEWFTSREQGTSTMVAVQTAARDRLIWQVMSASRLGAAAPGGPAHRHESVPFGYVRLSPGDGAATNDTFRRLFADEALQTLRDQVDSGVFAGGRTLLPGAGGRARLALAAIRSERSAGGDIHEIFLFVPDADTGAQLSAAETLEGIPISLIQLDLEGRVLWGNAQARDMIGDGFAPGAMLDDFVQPLGRSLDSLLNEVRSGRDGGSGEMVRLLDAGFDTFAQVSLTRMTLLGQPCLMAVLTDASELRLLEDKFAQSQKMEAVGKLAGGVAHDFNNVLTAISGHCDLLLLRKDASHPDFSDLMQIRQNANRAATLVRQLLAFSRKQTLQPKLLSVQDVVTDTLYLLDRLIGETITLALDHGRDLGSVRADHQQLEQALMNLVVNARDAMKSGGTVTIATRNVTIAIEEPRGGVSIPPGDYVEISVSDSGHGIEPHVIDKVFDPFFTTKPKGEGTGLGLSTVYGIVKQSGGYIYAENRESGGARFTILLPRAYPQKSEEVVEAAPAPVLPPPDLTGQGAVMLVEDEAPVRSFASRALKMRGYRVIEAESAEDAMALLTQGDENIDVLVSDVVMPGMDGPTFAGHARKLRPNLRVIFISGYAEDSFRRNLVDTDFLFLSKPFSLNELTAKVKVAMDARPSVNA